MKYFHYTMLVSDTMECYIADIVTIIDLAHILYLLYVLITSRKYMYVHIFCFVSCIHWYKSESMKVVSARQFACTS